MVRSSTVAAADFDNNGTEDLYVLGNTAPQYDPNRYPPDELYRNGGGGTFTPVRGQPWSRDVDTSNDCGWADHDRDGLLDVFVVTVSDTYAECLYRQRTDGSFVKLTAAQAGSIVGVNLLTDACSWADYDNDGHLDVFVPVHHGATTSQLLHNGGNGQWTAVPLGAALETGGGSWADYDNDGDLDLFVTRGQTTTTTNLFYANKGDGTFTQVTLGSLANGQGRWADSAWADYDNNGFQDLFVTGHQGTSEVLYRNHGNGNHWTPFKLVGTRSNRSAIGAKVRVQATIFGKTTWQMREISGGNRPQNDLRPHFGLGDAARAFKVRVEWPSGTVEEFANLARDQFHTIVEPSLRGALKANGQFELIVTATQDRVRTIEVSDDLLTWTVLTTVTGQGETPVTYLDTAAPGQNQRFYRMK